MDPFKRYLIQVLFWLGLWIVIWVSMSMEAQFIRTNGPSFILQCLLLFALICYAVPEHLFKQRYFSFLLLVIFLILLASYLAMQLGPPRMAPGNSLRMERGPPFAESRLFRQLLIMSITSLSAVLVETFTLAQQKQKSEALAKAELKESELKFLKMQINPHFLFNSLNNIYALSVTNSNKTQEGISTLSLMLRYVLYDCEQPKIALEKELQYIKHFITLFKLKSSEGYNIDFKEEIESDALMIAPMLLVPFIENAFKHSGIEKRGDSFVHIRLLTKGNEVEFSVENSIPTDQLVTDPQGGIGLQNVKRRLDLLYHGDHYLSIEKRKTFNIRLRINLA